jgi:hypothetical protein
MPEGSHAENATPEGRCRQHGASRRSISALVNEAGWEEQESFPTPFSLISSHTQMQRFMEAKDKRRMRLFNGCRAIYDLDKGRAFLEKKRPAFPTPALRKLSRLIERLDYMNVIVTTPQELSDWEG